MPPRLVPDPDWTDFDAKLDRLRAVAASAGCRSLVLKKPSTLSWLFGGRSHVPNTLESACFDVVFDVSVGLTVVVNAIEAPRLRATELAGVPAEFHVVPWWENRGAVLPSGEEIGSDTPLSGLRDLSEAVAVERRRLTSSEQVRLRELCTDAARATTRAALRLRSVMTEYEAAAALAHELLSDGMDPIVLMVAGQTRMARDRHPIPTSARLGPRAMLVCCARRHGLVASVTRIAAFEKPMEGQLDRYLRLLDVEAAFLDATRPGRSLGDVVCAGTAAYTRQGFAGDEWHRHHQGGLSGWEPREFPATPTSPQILEPGHVVAWNPSGEGWKVEDTCLVTTDGVEPLVHDPDWPQVVVDGRVRPGILEVR